MVIQRGDIYIDTRAVRRRLRILRGIITENQILDRIGNFLVAANKTRTLAGKDVRGRPFKPYSDRYRFWRSRHGYGTTPDLYLSGSMLGSMTYRVEKEQVRVFFMPGKDRKGVSNPAKAFWLQKDRQFFGIGEHEAQKIIDMYRQNIVIRGLRSGRQQ
jgi:hypothetical protein